MASMNFEYEISPTTNMRYTSPNNNQSKKSLIKDESLVEPKKCRYRSEVLVGNWFNRRATYESPPNDWSTDYTSTYTCKINSALKKDRIAQNDNKWKAEVRTSARKILQASPRQRGLGADFLISHNKGAFHNNYTTTNDLFFRILPQGRCDSQVRKYNGRKKLWLPEIDLTKNFGNLTKFYKNVDPQKPRFADIYAVKRHFKPKGEMNKPYLDHLDIDPNLPFRPHLIRAKT